MMSKLKLTEEKQTKSEMDLETLTRKELSRRQKTVEKIAGAVDWKDENTGFLECPGIGSHTTPDAISDCRVKINGVPTIYCFHTSCRSEIEQANKKIRRAILRKSIGKQIAQSKHKNESRKEKNKKAPHQTELKHINQELATTSKWAAAQIFSQYEIAPIGWLKLSPHEIAADVKQQWRDLLSLFKMDDTVWIGVDVHQSSATDAGFQRFFKTVDEWKNEVYCPGRFTCPAVFKPGSHSRSNTNVIRRPYLVVESDVLTKTQMGAVFKWMRQFMTLRAIVDTAGKSLHGWFDFPNAETEAELQIILPALGCDPALFKISQPCRLPGAMRNGRYQHLLYLNLEGVNK